MVRLHPPVIRIPESDDVAVAVRALDAGETVVVDGERIVVRQNIAPGHKLALRALRAGEAVRKYGAEIGVTTAAVHAGDWVHTHNLATQLDGGGGPAYCYAPNQGADVAMTLAGAIPTFMGYQRADGRVGTRNEIWILNTVGCVNHAAERIAKSASERCAGRVDGVHAFGHPYGCSQLGDDLQNTQRVLAGLIRHPNAGGVLVLGLGCENNQLDQLLALAGDVDRSRVAFFNTQDVIDELEQGSSVVDALINRVSVDRRSAVPASELVLGHKCGGSDGFSGITANPLLGRIADRVTAMGGRVLLTEVPEMFGAERALMARASNERVFGEIVTMINGFKDYFVRHGQVVSENPSPGNTAGGLTTLEEKSLGAVQKGGRARVTQVLRYGECVRMEPGEAGLALLESPGNDAVSSTAMIVSGATLLLFTTGRGTPLGFPVPTIKVSSNSEIAAKKPHWIDFDAGRLLDGRASMAQLEDELFTLVLSVASGEQLANNERQGYREIAIWKDGVTL